MSETYDVVIAGGAAMGSSTAYHLAADPSFSGRVLVVEKDPTYARSATALSLSSIRQQFSSPINIRVGLAGVAFLKAAKETLAVNGEGPDLPITENGYLYLATEAGAGALRANHETQIAEGANVALLTPEETKARYPFIDTSGLALASLGLSGEGWFDSYSLLQAFRRKAQSLGVRYVQDEVVGVERNGARITGVQLASGNHIGCGVFLNTSGASGAAKLARACGFSIPVESRKRCVFVFEARSLSDKFPLLIDPSGVYVRTEGRHYVIGGPPPEPDLDTDDFEVVWEQFEETLWPALAARIPEFEELKLIRAWAGHYDLNTFDHNAIVGLAPGYDNAYLAAGFSGHGVQQSPAVGRGLSELIAHGRYLTLDLSDFAYARIAAGRPLLERNVI
jgi:FAD-dependent oxidoreductase domain-containing protein 1